MTVRPAALKRKLIASGLAITTLATVVALAALILAALDSPFAPRGLLLPMIPLFAGTAGLAMVLAGCLCAMRDIQQQRRVVWRVETTLPADVGVAARSTLVRLPDVPLGLYLAAMSLIFILALSFVCYRHVRKWGALSRRGVETGGTITKKRIHEGKARFYSIEYRFIAAGSAVDGFEDIEEGRWLALKAGDPIRVTYLPKVPEISAPLARSSMKFTDFVEPKLLVLAVITPLLFAFMASLISQAQRRAMRLVREGVPVLATVTKVSGGRVSHSFETPSGTQRGSFIYNSAAVPRPAPGDQFVVLYDAERAGRNLPWPILRSFYASRDGDVPPPAAAGIIDRDLLERAAGPAPRFRLQWGVIAAFACLLLVLPLPIVARIARARALQNRISLLQREGRETQGSIVEMRRVRDWPEDATVVRYRYSVGGRVFTATTRINAMYTEILDAGHALVVTYLPSDPQRSVPTARADLAKSDLLRDASFFIPFGGCILACFAIAVAVAIVRATHELRVTRTGRIAIARVDASSGLVRRRCRYRFVADHGDVEQTVTVTSKLFRPAVGDRIEVLYTAAPVRSIPVGDLLFVKPG